MHPVIPSLTPKSADYRQAPKWWRASLERFGALLVLVCFCAGCATVGLPDTEEREAVRTGRQAIVLFRVTSDLHGESYEPFKHALTVDNIGLAVGGFKTGGRVVLVERQRFLSAETRRQGWIYFVLKPGTYYLAVQPPNTRFVNYKYAPRWRIDVPADTGLVYVGTLDIPGVGYKTWIGHNISFKEDAMIVRNEEDLARKVVAEHLVDLGSPRTVLMERHKGGTIRFRTPEPGKSQ